MSRNPTVSVVVPLFNETEAIPGLISNLAALRGECEVVLVDASDRLNAREEVTAAIESFPAPDRIRVVHSNERGRAVQMNLGAESSSGEIILFLHCDTRLPREAMQVVSETVCDGFMWGRFDVDLESRGFSYRLIECMLRVRSRVRRLATGDQAMYVTRDLFTKVGGFPAISLMEDIALCKLLNRHGPPALATTAVVTSARRWQNAGVCRTILLMWKLRFLYWIGVDPDRLAGMYRDER